VLPLGSLRDSFAQQSLNSSRSRIGCFHFRREPIFLDPGLCARRTGQLDCARPIGHWLPHALCMLHGVAGGVVASVACPRLRQCSRHIHLTAIVDPRSFAFFPVRFMCRVASALSCRSNASRSFPHRDEQRTVVRSAPQSISARAWYPAGSQLLLQFDVVE